MVHHTRRRSTRGRSTRGRSTRGRSTRGKGSKNNKAGATGQELIGIFNNIKTLAERGRQSIISDMSDRGGPPGGPRASSRGRSPPRKPRAKPRMRSPPPSKQSPKKPIAFKKPIRISQSISPVKPIFAHSTSGESKSFSLSAASARKPNKVIRNIPAQTGRFRVEDADSPISVRKSVPAQTGRFRVEDADTPTPDTPTPESFTPGSSISESSVSGSSVSGTPTPGTNLSETKS